MSAEALWSGFLRDHGLISVDEAAHRAKVGPQAIRKALGRGDLDGLRLGGVWFVLARSLRGYHPKRRES